MNLSLVDNSVRHSLQVDRRNQLDHRNCPMIETAQLVVVVLMLVDDNLAQFLAIAAKAKIILRFQFEKILINF